MKNSENKLLADVLSETEPPNFREALLEDTLRLARRRRYTRRLQHLSPLLVVVALALFFAPKKRILERPKYSPVEVVATQSMNPAAIISTTPLTEMNRISTTPCAFIVSTKSGSGGFRLIGDEELLAFAAPRSGVLIRFGPDSQTLIFANGPQPN